PNSLLATSPLIPSPNLLRQHGITDQRPAEITKESALGTFGIRRLIPCAPEVFRMARKQEVYWLSDAEWEAIQPHLPNGRRGARRVDDRRVISGIMHMLRSGGRWKDCPTVYGPCTTIYNRWNRWSRQGVWERIFYALTGSTGV